MAESRSIQSINNSFTHINNQSVFNKTSDSTFDEYFLNNSDIELTNEKIKQESRIGTTKHRDPLSLIDMILSNYILTQTQKATALADEISEISEAVADINHLWGKLMTECIGKVDPTDIKKKTSIERASTYHTIHDIMINTLGDPLGIYAISNQYEHNYDELQAANATMTAYCDTIQVDLDSMQQDFKNLMTAITSAQEEIRDVRRIVISFSDR